MKNLIIALILLFSLQSHAQEAAYSQWQNFVITPKYDQLQAFGESLHEHMKMYHQNAPGTGNVWRVDSGPNVGKWVLSMGPNTFSDHDNMQMADGHMAHWRNEVMPSIAHLEDGGIWRMQPDQSYLPDGVTITKARVIVQDRSGDNINGYYAAMKKLAETTKKQMPGQARILLNRVGFHNDHMDSVIFIGLEKWGDMDKSIREAYEKTHGEGSWDLFLDEVNTSIKSSYQETWSYIPYLSGIGDGN